MKHIFLALQILAFGSLPLLAQPVITQQPASVNTIPGGAGTFSCITTDTAPVTYQWFKDGTPLTDGGNIAGSTSTNLSVSNAARADAGNYFVVAADGSGSVTSSVAVLTVDLTTVDTFNPSASQQVSTIAVQPDGKVIYCARLQPFTRVNPDGTQDSTFHLVQPHHAASSIAVQPDGKIVFGYQASLYRYNPDGNQDITFPPISGGNGDAFNSITLQADGEILVGGNFRFFGGTNLIRLNAYGAVDTSFNPGANGTINTIQMQGDGKIIVGGKFTTLGGQPRNYIGRLNSNGTLDGAFNPNADGEVDCLALQADGKILVGGLFGALGGQSHTRIGRLIPDGTVDTNFNSGANNQVTEFAVQADGKILVGGQFSSLCGQSRNNIGRLNADGSIDATFNPGANGGVWSIELQEDGKILAGGTFTGLGGIGRKYIGRLSNTDPATESLTYDGTNIIWLRGGTLPEVWRTTFEQSTDGTNWTMLGAGTRIVGGWGLSGVIVANGNIRARGYSTGGDGWSSGLVQSINLESLTIMSPPVNLSVNPGQSATFDVGVVGSLPLSYQWYKGSSPLIDGGNVSGSGTALLTLSNAQNNDADNYFVVITNTYGAVTSTVASLMVITDPMIVSQPANSTIAVGGTSAFSIAATGTLPLSYQWYFNGIILSGATNTTLVASNSQFNAAGNYSVLVSNLNGSVYSTPATLSVVQQPPSPFNPRPGNFSTNVPASTNLAWNLVVNNSNLFYTELISNGDFESGSLAYWAQGPNPEGGQFYINNGTVDPPSPDGPLPPFAGNFSALGDESSTGTYYLYQTISIPANAPSVKLSWAHRVRNFYSSFSPSQQFQVRICDTNNNVLATAFTTNPGDPLLGNWVQTNYDMTAFAGQTVRVEFWMNVQLNFLDVHVDNVSVKTAAPLGVVFNDVYFGTNPTPGSAEYQGSTTNTTWPLPVLAPNTTFYWQILAQNGATTAGPVWQFTTAPLSPPQSFSGHPASGGGLQLQFSGTPNYPYILQMATDLTPPVNWQSILTNPADGNGNWNFTVTNLTDLPAGFYRVMGQ
jgi:uncharacterized delta-60 repeat protein